MSADLPEQRPAPSGRRAATAVEPTPSFSSVVDPGASQGSAAPPNRGAAAAPGVGTPAGPRSRKVLLWVVLVAVLAVVVVGALAILNKDEPGGADATATLERGTVTSSGLQLTGSAQSIALRADAPASDLVAVTATGADAAAEVAGGQDAVVSLAGDGASTVQVAPDVAWTVHLAAQSDTVTADLAGATVDGVSIDAGARLVELTLPTPTGAVVIDQAAGIGGLTVHVPEGVAVVVKVSSGAGTVVLDGETTEGVGAGEELSTDGYSADDPHYEIDVAGGLGTLTVDRG
ncbi:hypothetical protein KIN34_08400 [Cellulomonas sp. DKR-3]|uniref:Adhesin domain-containing protein n=1 Tax=Cellulomonas fulva TaxID=2835530 RepID=A0ABS5TYT1_9CELL|nr:cell wall-active antibiotics response protein [Cellulomonas fulva]MBT0994303.1 hypothetical protein [Cellulomonas fulva]